MDLIISQLSEYVTKMEHSLETKYDLNDFSMQKAQACIFKAKARYIELGENSRNISSI